MRQLLANLSLFLFHLTFVRPIVWWVAGARIRKRNLVPRGPCLVVSNHNSHLDAGVLMSLFPLRRLPHVHPVAAADYFGRTWLKKTMAMFFMNAVPIQRKPSLGTDPLAPIAERLKAGESLIFFPEGSRGEAGVVAPFRAGVGRLVRQVPGLLVVPVFLSGPERIWPRGELVPVPLNIDAAVGRPRTYSDYEDPRVIAEMVQRDVLALAPPPPPVPGPRPAPPVRISICGADPSAREDAFRAVVERLGRSGRTLGLADPVIEADTSGTREITGPIPHSRGRVWLGPLAVIFRTRGRFTGRKFVEMVERAQVDEALGHDREARFVVSDGSALVDLMAWATADFYAGVFDESGTNHLLQYLSGQKKIGVANWWKFIRKAPEVWLVNVFDLARPPVPEILVHVSLPASALMQRLRTRGEELLPHEREDRMERLQEGFRQVGTVLQKRHKVQYLEFDASRSAAQEIAAAVEAAVEKRIAEPSAEQGKA